MSDWAVTYAGGHPARAIAWPPRMKPFCHSARLLMEVLLNEPGGDIPRVVREASQVLGWASPYIFHYGGPRAEQIWRRNPALLVLLAKECPSSVRSFIGIIRQGFKGRDRDILRAVGYPAENGFLNALDKATGDAWSKDALRKLGQHWQDPRKRRWLYHVKVINKDLIETLDHPTGHLNWQLVERASVSPAQEQDVSHAIDMLEIEWRLYCTDRKQSLEPWPFKGLVYEQLHPAVHRLHLRRHSHIPFAPPPLPGTETIQPIRTLAELFSEGRKQQNCCYGFQQAIQEGRAYFFRVKRPKCRATLMLERDPEGFWKATELRAWGNSQPSDQCVEEVMGYLRSEFPLVEPKLLMEIPPIDCDEAWDEDGDFRPGSRLGEDEGPGEWDFPI